MRILVDADACKCVDDIIEVAKEWKVEAFFFHNCSKLMQFEEHKLLHECIVDNSKDSADFAIVNKAKKNDIIVTNDAGLMAMGLAKRARIINNNGLYITKDNINQFLTNRYIGHRDMRHSGRNKHQNHRGKNNYIPHTKRNFKTALHHLIRRINKEIFEEKQIKQAKAI